MAAESRFASESCFAAIFLTNYWILLKQLFLSPSWPLSWTGTGQDRVVYHSSCLLKANQNACVINSACIIIPYYSLIIPRARMGSESIAHEAEGLMA